MYSSFGGRGPLMMAVMWTGWAMSFTVVVLRGIAARHSPAGQWRPDFLVMALSATFYSAAIGLMTYSILNGMGNHYSDLSYERTTKAIHYGWAALYTGIPATALANTSLVLLLLHIGGERGMREKRHYLLYAITCVEWFICISLLFVSLTQCTPTWRLWEVLPDDFDCPRRHMAIKWSQMQGVISAILDITLALWPITVVWNLRLSRRKKISFCCLMAVSMLPAGFSLLRVWAVGKLEDPADPTYDLASFLLIAMTELVFIGMLASIPTLQPLFARRHRRGAVEGESVRRTVGSASAVLGKIRALIVTDEVDEMKVDFGQQGIMVAREVIVFDEEDPYMRL